RNIGLDHTSQIGAILIDPNDPRIVYVAAVGDPYGPNAQRGVFRTEDGGQSWRKVLFVNDQTGAVDLAMDPRDPQVIYASFWQVIRKPWGIYPDGPGSGIYKTTDGGDQWTRLTEGLPAGPMGKIGITVSPVNPDVVIATIGGHGHGIYRSGDAGRHWRLLSNAFWLTSRQYYYGHIFADPQKANLVYMFCSKSFLKSVDGGKTWRPMPNTTHSDYHDLWIDPANDKRWIVANDGGAAVTFNAGRSYSTEENQPTGQFYEVSTDNAFPYRVYGAQQDDTTVSIASRAPGGIGRTDWHAVGGGESGYVVPAQTNAGTVVYAGGLWGRLTRYDKSNGSIQVISPWPDFPGGRRHLRYRFQWTFPIAVSPAAPHTVYVGANVVFKSTDGGRSWTVISPDLTRHDAAKDAHGVLNDVYGTIFAIAPSPRDAEVIWTGSDDGRVYLTRDGGQHWVNVTPPALRPWSRISSIEAGQFNSGTAFVVANRYQLNDFRPYVYRTRDYGRSWQLVVAGLPADAFTRALREDHHRQGLLYLATETGVFVSFDSGNRWQSLQFNLPAVPVTDLTLKRDDLVISTQGRGFWILDDISPLEQYHAAAAGAAQLFVPRPAYRLAGGGFFFGEGDSGKNPPQGVIVDYYLPQKAASPVTLSFLDTEGQVISGFSSAPVAAHARAANQHSFYFRRPFSRVTGHAGLNRFVWDMQYPGAKGLSGIPTYLMGGGLAGPVAAPGRYQVRLTVDGQTYTQPFVIRGDPNLLTTPAQYEEQFHFLVAVRDELSRANETINRLRALQHQARVALRAAGDRPVAAPVRSLQAKIGAILGRLWQSHYTGFDDQTLVFPLRLNNQIAALQGYARGNFAPTAQDYTVLHQLSAQLSSQVAALQQIIAVDLPAVNAELRSQGLPVIEAESSRLTIPRQTGRGGFARTARLPATPTPRTN
ncbi:MAG: glycosyl hydrolase, partial [Terriglobales bacterium]